MSRTHQVVCSGFIALGLAACGAADGADEGSGEQEAALVSNTRVFVVPVDARVRTSCREQTNRYYCDGESAEAAAAECLAELTLTGARDACAAGGEKCLRYEVVDAPCAGAQEVYPTPASCEEPILNSCTFYSACVESNIACGEEGYALGYGEKFCTAFKNTDFSPRGEAWVESVMLCLQEALVQYTSPEDTSAACDEIQEFAFDSHPGCYTAPSNSICFLPPGDVLKVLQTIGGRELFTARTMTQIRSVIGTCITDIGKRVLFGGGAAGEPGAQQPSAFRASGPLLPAEALSAPSLEQQYRFWQGLDREYSTAPVE